MKRPRLNTEPTEKAIQRAVIQHWKAFGIPGTLVAAIPNANAFGQAGLTKGLFDLLVIGIIGGPRQVGFIELKAAKGVMSPHQMAFQTLLMANQIPYAVTYGREQPIQVLEAWGIVRPQAEAA